MDMRRTASVFMIWNAICVYVGKVLSIVTILFFVGGGFFGWGGVVVFWFFWSYFADKRNIQRKIDI